MTLTTDKPLRWLIVEDALKDYKGHWFEYLSTFCQGLKLIGDPITILSDREALPFIGNQLPVIPILPISIWHRMGDSAGILTRYLRVPIHAWQTVRVIKRYLTPDRDYDVIFVPTVLVHHLLGWTWLVKRVLKHRSAKLILFFPNAPVSYDTNTQTAAWTNSPTTRLLRWLIKQLKAEVQTGKVILGAETHTMQQALSSLSGVPFTYFPHPVLPICDKPRESSSTNHLIMGSYGGARHEKGNDILFKAIAEFSDRYPNLPAQFILQCLEGFDEERALLRENPSVTWITEYFQEGEYAKYLGKTDLLLLSYRPGSYALRVSRVVIEAMVNSIPVITTRDTTLAEQAQEFGSVILCESDDPSSLADAIAQAVEHYAVLKEKAEAMVERSQAHFSVQHFRECFINSGADQPRISPKPQSPTPLAEVEKTMSHF